MALADDLIEKASKDQMAEVARLLALTTGWHHQRYGDVPQAELLAMFSAETLSEEGKTMVLHGMQNLLSALAEVMGVTESGEDEARHQPSRGLRESFSPSDALEDLLDPKRRKRQTAHTSFAHKMQTDPPARNKKNPYRPILGQT
jgi:hypothetical protein